jgi:hypothetical protein
VIRYVNELTNSFLAKKKDALQTSISKDVIRYVNELTNSFLAKKQDANPNIMT